MAITLSVWQPSDGTLRVHAGNFSDHVAIIDHIVLSVYTSWIQWHGFYYQDDFYFGSGRVGTNWSGLMVKINYSLGPGTAKATAAYWEVDQSVTSPLVNIS